MDVVEKRAQAKARDGASMSVSYVKSHFREHTYVEEIIAKMVKNVTTYTQTVMREECDTVVDIFMQYQEKPGLLDTHLGDLISPIMKKLSELTKQSRHHSGPGAFAHLPNAYFLARIIYALIIVRGYKVIMKYFPVEPSDVEPVLAALERGGSEDGQSGRWHLRHIYLLWLAILMLVPFKFDALDTNVDDKSKPDLQRRVIAVGTQFLNQASKVREAASVLLGKLFSRADAHVGGAVEDFIQWCIGIVHNPSQLRQLNSTQSEASMLATGALHAIYEILKRGSREASRPLLPDIFDKVVSYPPSLANNCSLVRKLRIKCCGRLALALLPPKIISWRYSRGARVLALAPLKDEIHSGERKEVTEKNEENTQEIQEKDVPIEIEDIVDILLVSLSDSDTNVRWSAAKGIGRIANRLPRRFAEDIACALFKELQGVGSQERNLHGGILAVAELLRRGLLLDDILESAVGHIVRILHFDITSNKAHATSVRDAACYGAWSIARALNAEQVKNVLPSLVDALIPVSLFDREVNCRRASSAALQEIIGRIGGVKNGINLVRALDFFALASIKNCYLKISLQVASLGYGPVIARFLLETMVSHSDTNVRALVARSIGQFVSSGTILADSTLHEMRSTAANRVANLVEGCTSLELEKRHGNLLALSYIVRNMPGIYASSELQDATRNVVIKIEKARLYTGKGGEKMRDGVCMLVAALSASDWSFKPTTAVRYLKTINESIVHLNPQVQLCARDALVVLSSRLPDAELRETYFKIHNGLISSSVNIAARKGYASALGALPVEKLCEEYIAPIVKTLAEETASTLLPKNSDLIDPECRLHAMTSLLYINEKIMELMLQLLVIENNSHKEPKAANNYSSSVSNQTGKEKATVWELSNLIEFAKSVRVLSLKALCLALQDNQVDRRGDVGSWIREAAAEGVGLMMDIGCKYHEQGSILRKICNDEEIKRQEEELIALLLSRCVDRLDKPRSRSFYIIHYLYIQCESEENGKCNRHRLTADQLHSRVHRKRGFAAISGSGDMVGEKTGEEGHKLEENIAEEDMIDFEELVSVRDTETIDRTKLPFKKLIEAKFSSIPLTLSTQQESAFGSEEVAENAEEKLLLTKQVHSSMLISYYLHPLSWGTSRIFEGLKYFLYDNFFASRILSTWIVTAGHAMESVVVDALEQLVLSVIEIKEEEARQEMKAMLSNLVVQEISTIIPPLVLSCMEKVLQADKTLEDSSKTFGCPKILECSSKSFPVYMMTCASRLIERGCFDVARYGIDLTRVIYIHIFASVDPAKIRAGVQIFMSIACYEESDSQLSALCIALCVKHLCHSYPIIRTSTVKTIFDAFSKTRCGGEQYISKIFKDDVNCNIYEKFFNNTLQDLSRYNAAEEQYEKEKQIQALMFSFLNKGYQLSQSDGWKNLLTIVQEPTFKKWYENRLRLMEQKSQKQMLSNYGYSDLLRFENTGML